MNFESSFLEPRRLDHEWKPCVAASAVVRAVAADNSSAYSLGAPFPCEPPFDYYGYGPPEEPVAAEIAFAAAFVEIAAIEDYYSGRAVELAVGDEAAGDDRPRPKPGTLPDLDGSC